MHLNRGAVDKNADINPRKMANVNMTLKKIAAMLIENWLED